GMVAQWDAGRTQLVLQRAIAVDLAIEGESIAGARIDARLGPTREIDDGEPRVAERDAAIDEDTVLIGAAMHERRIHRCKETLCLRPRTGKTGNTAHDAITSRA